jgi:serine/threonine protein kinase
MMTKYPMFPGNSEIDQLYKIFRLLGTPTEKDWKGVSYLPDYNTLFPSWDRKFKDLYLSEKYNIELLNLIESLLIMNPIERPEVDQVLAHPFYNDISSYVYDMYKKDSIINIRDRWFDNIIGWNTTELYQLLDSNFKINDFSRLVLLDWLTKICVKYNVKSSTYIRTQNIIDKYISFCKEVSSQNIYIIGLAALLISSKIDEIYSWSLDNIGYISDNIFTFKKIAKMEKDILKIIDIDVYFPITISFLSTYSRKMKLDPVQEKEIEFILIYITYNLDLMKYPPSILSLCACLYVSEQTYLTEGNSDSSSEEYIREDIVECMEKLN